ncbi:hypothetical protein OHB54_14965 [Streptomyces sp. NBC_01007]|nr:hypothetical protein OHB54_14965 [Streptomyces sp. NBC_01007]
MRALATRPQRLALACALISAAALGTVSASAASASDRSTGTAATAVTSVSSRLTLHSGTGEPPKGALPPKGAMPAIAYRPTAQAPGDVNIANGRFATCMRDRGQKVFPVFHASKDKRGRVLMSVQLKAGKRFDPTSKSYRADVKACAPILKKAGISFSTGAGLPPLPAPGKPGSGPGTRSGGGSIGGSVGGSVGGSTGGPAGGSVGGSRKLPPHLHTEKGQSGVRDLPSLSVVTESA